MKAASSITSKDTASDLAASALETFLFLILFYSNNFNIPITIIRPFNVYGPGEYHKGRMASVIFHAFNQIKQTGKVQLFKSHKPEFKDGEHRI